MTSTQPAIEVLRHPKQRYNSPKEVEHVVPISQGFYVSFRGVFTPESRLEIVYAAFSYRSKPKEFEFDKYRLSLFHRLPGRTGFSLS